jgi:hypothetical protein
MAPQLEHVFTMRGYMAETTVDLGAIKSGPNRSITGITHGFIKGVPGSRGEGLNVNIISGGGDWILFDPKTNICHLDVRTQGTTPDGESIFVYYHGFLENDEAGAKFLRWDPDAKTTKCGDHQWFSSPRIETSSECAVLVIIRQVHFVIKLRLTFLTIR